MTARAPRSVDLRRVSSALAPLQKMLDAQLQGNVLVGTVTVEAPGATGLGPVKETVLSSASVPST